MFHGKPVIVTDAGFSGSIPSDCVLKVRPPHEAEDLTQHLETLVTNHTGRETLGKSAQRWADAEHAPEVYASRIEPLLAAAAEGRPLFDALNQISSTLHLMGVGYRDPLAEQIGSEFQRLFLGEKPENTRLHPTADCIQPTAAICNVLRESETDQSTGRSTGQVEPTDLPGDSRRRSEGDLQKRSLHTRAGQLMWRFGVRCTEPILSRLRGYLVEP